MRNFKFLIYFLLVMGFKNSFAQDDDIQLKASCFASGDVSTVSDMLKYPTVTLVTMGSVKDVKLVSYDFDFSGTTSKNNDFGFTAESISRINKLRSGQSLAIKDITVEVTNKKTKKKEMVTLNPVKIQIGDVSSHQCGTKNQARVEYNGKLLTGKATKVPVKNQKVILQNHEEKELQSATTNNYGYFKFSDLDPDESYKINVKTADSKKIKDGVLYAAKPDGVVIRTFNKTAQGFVYDLLPAELNVLLKEKEEDTQLKIKNFGSSSDGELTVIENIYYESNSAEIKPESFGKLDRISDAMKQNTALKLFITSHTDSKGDDAYNMTLSEKRAQNVMNYFILLGIDKNRLTAKGMGETQIMNRCKNDVDCSELEHQLNRRTEFKFTK